MANIYDVAKRAKVSTATVSKVLSNTPYVSAETRERVLEAVRVLNYQPSLAARSLSGSRTFIIGLVIPYDPGYLFTDPFLLEVIRGIEQTAVDNDYNLLLSMANQNLNQSSAYNRILRSHYVDGAITLETHVVADIQAAIRQATFPWVSVGYPLPDLSVSSVHSDDYTGMLTIGRHLMALGHRRIAVINGAADLMSALDERMRGLTDALAEVGATLDPALVANGDFTVESGYSAAQTLLAQDPRPTAICAFNDRMAIGAMRRAREMGISVPGDLSVTGFDDVALAEVVDPPLTTIRQNSSAIGSSAATLLFERIGQGKKVAPPEDKVLPIAFIERASTAVPRA